MAKLAARVKEFGFGPKIINRNNHVGASCALMGIALESPGNTLCFFGRHYESYCPFVFHPSMKIILENSALFVHAVYELRYRNASITVGSFTSPPCQNKGETLKLAFIFGFIRNCSILIFALISRACYLY